MYSFAKYIYKELWSKKGSADSTVAEKEENDSKEMNQIAPSNMEALAASLLQDCDLTELRNECPHIFLSNHRNVRGIVESIIKNEMVVEVEHGNIIIDLNKTKAEFAKEVGDHVCVLCHVEQEELFNGEVSEVLEPIAIFPTSKRRNQKCSVTEIRKDLVVLSNDCYISKDVLQKRGGPKLNEGENLYIDMIECNWENFKWRCISFASLKNSNLSNSKGEQKNHSRQVKPQKQRLIPPTPTGRWNSFQNRLGEYANQVWTQENREIIPAGARGSTRRFKAVRIPSYEVPSDIRITYLTQCTKSRICHQEIEISYPVLKQDLSFNNYLQRFQLLIWLEEIELYKNFRLFDAERVQFEHESNLLSLTILNLGERRPSLCIGDKVLAFPIDDNLNTTAGKGFEGNIQGIQCDKILLKFHNMFHQNYKNEFYRLEFYFSRVNFRRKHYALFRAFENLGKDFLFPEKLHLHDHPQLDIRMDDIKWFNPNLNTLQRFAVFNVLRGEAANMPYVIYGPPGTGKTLTLVECILQLVTILPHSRLLVATPSNSAANLICTRLIDSKGLHKSEMVRLVSYNLIDKDQIPADIIPYCATVDLGDDGTYEEEMYTTEKGLQMNCPMRFLAHYRVTIGTCSSLGKYLELGFNGNHFTHVLVDEAGQCTEPEIMVPLSQTAKSRGQVVLAGDPMQLHAVVVNKYADCRGLAISFLERLMNTNPYRKDGFVNENCGYNPLLITKLRDNYRSLPSIMRIYNYLFYDLELMPKVPEFNSPELEILEKVKNKGIIDSKQRPAGHGAFFYEVRGENMREPDSPSWCNPREAQVVYATTLLILQSGLVAEDIGIITPYMKQARLIRALFAKASMTGPKVGSVEEFQGQERNVILLSTVRTSRREILNYDWRHGLGFVKSERRLNVAISRARALLIVFGDSSLLRTDSCWCIYINECINNHGYLGLTDSQLDKPGENVVNNVRRVQNGHENDGENEVFLDAEDTGNPVH